MTIRRFILCFVGFVALGASASAQKQTDSCRVQFIRLKFSDTFQPNGEQMNDRVLLLAKATDSLLISDSAIKKFRIETETIYGTYESMLITSHQYELTDESVSRLSSLQIPLRCGMPVAVKVCGIEVYRGMLWHPVSSF
jgi:hypothetical protein